MTATPALLANISIDRVGQDTSLASKPEQVMDLSSVLWGRVIPIFMGTVRLGGDLLWLQPNSTINVSTLGTWAVTFGHPLTQTDLPTIKQMWGAGISIYNTASPSANLAGLQFVFYPGSEGQLQDPTMAAAMGSANVPAFRDLAYAVFTRTPLASFNGIMPYVSAVLSTRVGNLTLSDWILGLAARTALVPNVDIVIDASVDDTFEGALLTKQTSLRDEITHLAELYEFDTVDGDIITIKRVALSQSLTADAVIDSSEFVDGSADNIEVQEPTEVPTSFTVNYLDKTVDYNSVPITAHRSTFPLPVDGSSTAAVTSIDLPFAMDAGKALTLAKNALNRLWRKVEVISGELPTQYYGLQCGDVLRINYPSSVSYLFKITAQTLTADFKNKITAKSLYTNASYAQVGDAGSTAQATIYSPTDFDAQWLVAVM